MSLFRSLPMLAIGLLSTAMCAQQSLLQLTTKQAPREVQVKFDVPGDGLALIAASLDNKTAPLAPDLPPVLVNIVRIEAAKVVDAAKFSLSRLVEPDYFVQFALLTFDDDAVLRISKPVHVPKLDDSEVPTPTSTQD